MELNTTNDSFNEEAVARSAGCVSVGAATWGLRPRLYASVRFADFKLPDVGSWGLRPRIYASARFADSLDSAPNVRDSFNGGLSCAPQAGASVGAATWGLRPRLYAPVRFADLMKPRPLLSPEQGGSSFFLPVHLTPTNPCTL
jgi:hypothetical protein